jgi:sugar lactone lactonase YvrE
MQGNSVPVPECVVGEKYAFEPVPTDVEIGPDGWLYVTSLPGGPEGPEMGPRGAVFKVNPWNGDTTVWADHILSPTGLAVADNGDVYVASLFGGEILKFTGDAERSRFLSVNQPADVEYRDGDVFATVDALMGLSDPSAPDASAPKPAGRVIEVDR